MQLQGGSANLQGGTSIAVPTRQAYTQPINVQPATSVYDYPATSTVGGSSGSGGGSVLGASTTSSASTTPTYSTYQQSLLDALPTQISNITSSAHQAAGTAAGDYNTKILDFLDSLRIGQKNIDNQSVQNELARKQGTQGVLDMVGHGIQSGGVLLANKNAGSSSATEALARAYGILGRQQQTGINNQYAQGQNSIQNAQDTFGIQQQSGQRDITQGKQDAINAILQQANYQLSYLDSQLINASLPDKLNIQQQQDAIRQDAANQLAQYDPVLANGVSGIAPSSVEANRAKAQQLATSGTAAENPFNFTSQIPAQFQNSGPFASSLPIFTFPSRKQTA